MEDGRKEMKEVTEGRKGHGRKKGPLKEGRKEMKDGRKRRTEGWKEGRME